MAFGALASPVLADRAFSQRFTKDDVGDITIVANTLMTCPLSDSDCGPARQGIGTGPSGTDKLNNNNYTMQRVDADGDPTTFTSSSATLTLPADATVLFAGLYYGARHTSGTNGQPAPDTSLAGRATVKFRPPGAAAYLSLGPAGTVLDLGASSSFAGFRDVTDLVAAAGPGPYFVADVQSGTGVDRYAGWALVVAYRDTSQPARNLSIFDGLQSVSQNNAVSIPITGFRTPPAGPVRTTIGGSAYEGDRGTPNDIASLDNIAGRDAVRPADNFFNSTISRNGAHFTAKNPNFVNQFGFDATLINATGVLQNGATSAVIRTSTTGDVFLPHVIVFATELFAPDIGEPTKTVQNVTNPGGPDRRGDTLRYTIGVSNAGQDGATDFEATDLIPAGTTYVPGSLRLVTGPGSPASPTDAAGDDVAEFDAANTRVVIRLGTGANATQGGLIGAAGTSGSSASFTFDVTIDGDNADGAEIVNQGRAEFFAQSLGTPLSALSSRAVTTVAAPDLTIAKSHTGPLVAGGITPFTIQIENQGGHATDGSTVTVSDTFPAAAFATITVTSATGWSCNVLGTELTCTRSDVLAAGDRYPPIQLNALVVPALPAAIENTASVAGGGDSDPTNNSSTDVGPGVVEADLQLTKHAEQETVLSGEQAVFTLVVRNGGPSAATGVVVDDPLAPNFSAQSVSSTQGSCDTTVTCTIGTLAPGAEATITIHATVTGTGPSHDNTATVTSGSPDPTPGNNVATVAVTVPNTADLTLAKTAAPATPEAGVPDGLTYTLSVANTGPATATSVRVTDPLPEQFTPSSAGGVGFTCNLPAAGGTLECTRPALAVGAGPVEITVVGTIAPASAAQTIKNSATVEADQGDPALDSNAVTTTTVVIPAADLDVTKTANRATLRPGERITYTVKVVNNGPSEATNVDVSDTLGGPSRTIVSVSSSQGSCTTAGPIECALGDLPEGAEATVTLVVRARGLGTLRNDATVTSDIPDPIASNDASGRLRAVVTVGPLRLVARELLVFRSLRSGVSCRLTGGPLRSCRVTINTLGDRLLARGTARAGGGGRNPLPVRVRLTSFGRALLDSRLGGVAVRARAKGIATTGARRADSERVRAIIDPERFRTPPGAWVPNRAILTPTGERFLRSLRGKLRAVRRVICEGHTARVSSVPLTQFAIALSTARARLVCARLRGLGVRAPSRIVFKGGTQPIASNATEAGRQKNRRVEVVLRH